MLRDIIIIVSSFTLVYSFVWRKYKMISKKEEKLRTDALDYLENLFYI